MRIHLFRVRETKTLSDFFHILVRSWNLHSNALVSECGGDEIIAGVLKRYLTAISICFVVLILGSVGGSQTVRPNEKSPLAKFVEVRSAARNAADIVRAGDAAVFI